MKAARVAAILAVTAIAFAGGLWVLQRAHARPPTPLTPEEQLVKDALRGLLQREDAAAAAGDRAALAPLFDTSASDGAAALRHAEARLSFVQAWAAARGVRWQPPAVTVRTPRIRFGSGDPPGSVRVTAIVSEAWTYVYPDGQRQSFGLGREHYMTLTRTGDTWRIAADAFTDPLDQDTRIPGPASPEAGGPPAATPSRAPSPSAASPEAGGPPAATPSPAPAPAPKPAGKGYNRAGAVSYADRYCGAAPGCGNGGRYNPALYDYNGEGGDCTNFISQALRFGGGLRETGTWAFDRRTGEGTDAWAKAPDLVAYLTGSGLARTLVRGHYDKVAPVIGSTLPGDLIAYVERGAIVHMAMIVARDPHGYVLVDSHTADRHHVPWDIGWDQSARFIVLRVTGGAASAAAKGAPPSAFVPLAAGCGASG